jgi:hypothetical protein
VLFLFGRRCGPGEGLSVSLNTEDKKKGIERSLPRWEHEADRDSRKNPIDPVVTTAGVQAPVNLSIPAR